MNPPAIKKLRHDLSLTQTEFANKIGVTSSAVSNWESGKTSPRKPALAALKGLKNGALEKARAEKTKTSPARKRPARQAGYGPWLSEKRDKQGLSRVELAELSGVSVQAIEKIEIGITPNPREETKAKLGAALEAKSKPPEMTYGSWLLSKRLAAQMTPLELADRAGVSKPAVDNLESGQTVKPQEATREKLEALLGKPPKRLIKAMDSDSMIGGVGRLLDFDPWEKNSWPKVPGVYVLYDIAERPTYIGKSENKISQRIHDHHSRNWFARPFVQSGSYVKVTDKALCKRLEQTLIRFLKSNAIVNKQDRVTGKE